MLAQPGDRMNGCRLPQGPVLLSDYQQLVSAEEFRSVEWFSAGFLQRYRELLASYGNRWVADPLHHWSRQWEYPFVLREIEHFAGGANDLPLKILDAGSGITFFPYYVINIPLFEHAHQSRMAGMVQPPHAPQQIRLKRNAYMRTVLSGGL